MEVALKTKAMPITVSRSVARSSGRSMSGESRAWNMSAPRQERGRDRRDAFRRRGMEEALQHLAADGRRGGAAVPRVLDQHRDRDAGGFHGGETDEEGVILAVRVLRRAGLAGDGDRIQTRLAP